LFDETCRVDSPSFGETADVTTGTFESGFLMSLAFVQTKDQFSSFEQTGTLGNISFGFSQTHRLSSCSFEPTVRRMTQIFMTTFRLPAPLSGADEAGSTSQGGVVLFTGASVGVVALLAGVVLVVCLIKKRRRTPSEQSSEDPITTHDLRFDSDGTVETTIMSYHDPLSIDGISGSLNPYAVDSNLIMSGRSLVELSLL
jgi:hypothetical protein